MPSASERFWAAIEGTTEAASPQRSSASEKFWAAIEGKPAVPEGLPMTVAPLQAMKELKPAPEVKAPPGLPAPISEIRKPPSSLQRIAGAAKQLLPRPGESGLEATVRRGEYLRNILSVPKSSAEVEEMTLRARQPEAIKEFERELTGKRRQRAAMEMMPFVTGAPALAGGMVTAAKLAKGDPALPAIAEGVGRYVVMPEAAKAIAPPLIKWITQKETVNRTIMSASDFLEAMRGRAGEVPQSVAEASRQVKGDLVRTAIKMEKSGRGSDRLLTEITKTMGDRPWVKAIKEFLGVAPSEARTAVDLVKEGAAKMAAPPAAPPGPPKLLPGKAPAAPLAPPAKPAIAPKAAVPSPAPTPPAAPQVQPVAPKPPVPKPAKPIPKIVGQEPFISLPEPIKTKDVKGNKITLPADSYTPHLLNTGNVLLQDGEQFIVPKNQYQNIKGKAIKAEAKEFAPELGETKDVVKTSTLKKYVGGERVKVGDFAFTVSDPVETNELGHLKVINEAGQIRHLRPDELEGVKTKFSQHTLPGGENYREVLIRGPGGLTLPEGYSVQPNPIGSGAMKTKFIVEGPGEERYGSGTTKEEAIANFTKMHGTMFGKFQSSHWDEPNVLAHLRMNDRTTPDGKKVLFIEELQSDWALKARKEGVKPPETFEQYWQRNNYLSEDNYTPAQIVRIKREFAQEQKPGVPGHPLLKNWQDLTLKRALKEAVDGNYDYLSWVSGKQTADRYDLAKHLDNITYDKIANGNYQIYGYKDNQVLIEKLVSEADLPELVGKDVAQKIVEGKGEIAFPDSTRRTDKKLSGLDLKIGGEWAANLYDRQVPNILKKLTGEKAETISINLSPEFKTSEGIPRNNQQAIKITPEIRARVKGEHIPVKQPSGIEPELKLSTRQMSEQKIADELEGLTDKGKQMVEDMVRIIDWEVGEAGGTGIRMPVQTEYGEATGEWIGIKSLRPKDLVDQPLPKYQKYQIARDRLEGGYKGVEGMDWPPDVEFLIEAGKMDKARELDIRFPVIAPDEYKFVRDVLRVAKAEGLPLTDPEIERAKELMDKYEYRRKALYGEEVPGDIEEAPEAVLKPAAGPEYAAEQRTAAAAEARRLDLEARRAEIEAKGQKEPLAADTSPLLAEAPDTQPMLFHGGPAVPEYIGQDIQKIKDILTGKTKELPYDWTKENLQKRPVTAQYLPTEKIEDPVLGDVNQQIEQHLTRAKQRGKKDMTLAGMRDVRFALQDMESKTGVPVYQAGKEIMKAFSDVQAETGDRMAALFEGTGLLPKDVVADPGLQQKLAYYIDRGSHANELTDAQKKLAENIKQELADHEALVKRTRHQRWMRTGELPPNVTGEEGIAMMERGRQVFRSRDTEAYDKWLDESDFGVRERYVPGFRQAGVHPLTQPDYLGRGFTRTREGDFVYNPERPLFQELNRYVKRALNIEKLEPRIIDLYEMLSENGLDTNKNIDLLDYWKDMLLGRSKVDMPGRVVQRTASLFWKANIPQKLARWVGRNLMQPTVYVLPKTFDPLSGIFWKNLGSLYSGFTGTDVFANNRELLKDPEFMDNFRRYVSSLNALGREYFFMEGGDFETVNRLEQMMTTMAQGYSWSDQVNRTRALVHVYNLATDHLKAYRADPTKANFNKFLRGTGALYIEDLELRDVLHLVDQGKDKEAAFQLGKIMADNANFMYKRAFKGLLEQGPTAQTLMTIFTFAKGSGQDLIMRGIKPLIDWSRAAKEQAGGKGPEPTELQTKRAYMGIQALAGFYLASLMVNRAQEKIMGLEQGSYGLGTLRWVPGGVFIATWMRLAEDLYSAIEQRKGWDYKIANTINSSARAFVPFYDIATKAIASQKGIKYYNPPLEIRNKIKELAGTESRVKQRKYVERNVLEYWQHILFGGARGTQSEALAEAYADYLQDKMKYGETHSRTIKRKNELERRLRLYPVSEDKRDYPRKAEFIQQLYPGMDIDKTLSDKEWVRRAGELEVDIPNPPKKITIGKQQASVPRELMEEYVKVRDEYIDSRLKSLPEGSDERVRGYLERVIRSGSARARATITRKLRGQNVQVD